MPTYVIEGRTDIEGPQVEPVQIYRDIPKQDIDRIVNEGAYKLEYYYWVSEVTEQENDIYLYDKLLYIKEPQGEFIPVESCEICDTPTPVPELGTVELNDVTQVACNGCYSKFKEDWN